MGHGVLVRQCGYYKDIYMYIAICVYSKVSSNKEHKQWNLMPVLAFEL